MRTDTRNLVPITVLILAAMLAQPANGEEIRDLIIRDVHIVGTGSQTEHTLANIRIEGNKINLVSRDTIPAQGDTQVLDANNGYLLGKLTVGSAPKFMILSDDPTADLDVLLDTRQFVTFAVDDGELVVNNLQPVHTEPDDPSVKARSQGWLSYQPPPFAIPTSVEASRKWNTFRTKYVNGLFFSALALDRQWISQDTDSRTQFGDLNNYERGTIRAWRFGFAGTLNFDKPWIYNVTFTWNPFDHGFDDELNEFQFIDYSVNIPVGKNTTVSIGNQKEPINMERTLSLLDLAAHERAAFADAMYPTRNFGVAVNGTAARQRVSWAGGVFNDWMKDSGSFDNNSTQVIGRVTWLPFLTEDQSNLFHVGLGVRYSDTNDESLRYSARPEMGNAPRFIDTGIFDAESSTLYNLEAGWRSGPYWILAEYTDNHVDAPDVGNPRFKGYHISGTWSLSGEIRPYRKPSGAFGGLPVAQNVNQGGWGAWELGLRYSSTDLTDGDIEGGEMEVVTAQLAWWATRNMLVSLNYRRTWTDRFGIDGEMDSMGLRAVLFLQ